MSKRANLRYQRIHAKKALHSAIMEHGEGWRNLNLWEFNFRKEFLKSWEKYLKGEGQDEFLLLAKQFGYLIKLKNIEHIKMMQKIKPYEERARRLSHIKNM